MAELVVTSPANPRLKEILGLRRPRVRAERGRTLVDGLEEVALALAAGVRPETVLHCPELVSDHERASAVLDRARAAGAEVVRLSAPAFAKVSYRQGPDGFLAVTALPGGRCADLELPGNPLVLVCEQVEKPGNLGAMLRTADAAGVAAVISVDPVTDWGNPNVVRASKGTVFAVPVASDPLETVLSFLDHRGVALLAATPEAPVEHTEVDCTGPLAIAVGAEKHGLSERLTAAARHQVRIPMVGRADSLNVSTSAAVLLYEAVRQRRSAGARGT